MRPFQAARTPKKINHLLNLMRYTRSMRHFSTSGQGHAFRAGFSLIELSIVVAILSIVSVLGLEVATSFISARAYDATKAQLEEVDDAIRKFYWLTGRLPCPADRTLAPTNANYGKEDCGNAISPAGGTAIGAIPFRSLNLQPSMTIDGYGSKINYYVTADLARNAYNDPSGFVNNSGEIEVRSGRLEATCTTTCSILANDAIYALISFGADRRGAVSRQGVLINSCSTATTNTRIDAQNCFAIAGGTAVSPVPTVVAPATYTIYNSRFNNGSQNVNYFDDIVLFRKKSQL